MRVCVDARMCENVEVEMEAEVEMEVEIEMEVEVEMDVAVEMEMVQEEEEGGGGRREAGEPVWAVRIGGLLAGMLVVCSRLRYTKASESTPPSHYRKSYIYC